MLEPNKPPKLMRRRLRQKARPAPPAPLRSPEGRKLIPPDNILEMRQQGYLAPSAPVPLNLGQSRSTPRRRSPNASPAEDSHRFNLRNLLGDRSSSQNGRSSQRRKESKTARSRVGSPQSSQIFDPIASPRPGMGLQVPVMPAPGALSRKPSRSKLTSIQQSSMAPSSGQVRVLNPYPIALPTPVKGRRLQRRPRRKPSALLYMTRLLILGIGVGAIAGTFLSVWNPASREQLSTQITSGSPFSNPAENASTSISGDLTLGGSSPLPIALRLDQPIAQLATTVQSLTTQYPGLTPGVFVVDLDTAAYLDLNGGTIFSAASTIKVPILVAFLQDVDVGKIRLDELLTLQQSDMASGSGELQDQPVGSQYSALETATKMITISDNTATNMLITRLGGAEVLNQRFRSWGLTNTVIRNPLPDLGGTNMTSPKELTGLLAMVSQGDLLSLRSRDRLFEIMQGTITNTLLPSGLDTGATIAHKTGNIDMMVGDTGIVDMPNGKRFVITVIVQRPTDDDRAQELIRQISRTVYQHFSIPQTPQLTNPLPTQVSLPEAPPAPHVPLENGPNSTYPRTGITPSATSPLPVGGQYPNTADPNSPSNTGQ